MSQWYVLSAVGRDRPGLIHGISHAIHELGGNIELQRSVRAASEYALILLFTLPENATEEEALNTLRDLGDEQLFVAIRPASGDAASESEGSHRAELSASGADQPGVIDAVTKLLYEKHVNVESMNYGIEGAPWTGEPLFKMKAVLSLPGDLNLEGLRESLRNLEDDYNFDILFEPGR